MCNNNCDNLTNFKVSISMETFLLGQGWFWEREFVFPGRWPFTWLWLLTLAYGPDPQFIFTGPGSQFVFTGTGSIFLFIGPGLQFVFTSPGSQLAFTGPGPRFVFTGLGPKFVFTGPSLQCYYQSGVWVSHIPTLSP